MALSPRPSVSPRFWVGIGIAVLCTVVLYGLFAALLWLLARL